MNFFRFNPRVFGSVLCFFSGRTGPHNQLCQKSHLTQWKKTVQDLGTSHVWKDSVYLPPRVRMNLTAPIFYL